MTMTMYMFVLTGLRELMGYCQMVPSSIGGASDRSCAGRWRVTWTCALSAVRSRSFAIASSSAAFNVKGGPSSATWPACSLPVEFDRDLFSLAHV
jgi:hypothetical protein